MDSLWFMKILHVTQFVEVEEMIIRIHFLIRAVETDVTSLFSDDPKVLLKNYLEFINKQAEWNDSKENLQISKARDFLKLQIVTEKVKELDETLNFLFERFFMQLKMEGRILPFKKDYL